MIRTLAVATVLVLLAAPAADAQARRPRPLSVSEEADRCNGSNPEILDCVARILDREDARLNRAYKAALARLRAPQQAALRAEQRQWIKDRDAECENEEDQGAAQASIYQTICHAEWTDARADELERYGRGRR